MGLKVWSWIAFAAALAACGWIAAVKAPARAPQPGVETTRWLATMSLIGDDDLRFESADSARFRVRFGRDPVDVRLVTDSRELDSPPIATRVWAAAARVSPERGPYLANWIVLSGTLLLAAWVLGPTLGAAAPLWMAILLFGSSLFTEVSRLSPEILVLAMMVVACALVWGKRRLRETQASEIYEGELPGERPPALDWRWLFAGLALGAAAVRSPLYLLPGVAFAADLPKSRRAATAIFFAAGILLPLAFVGGADSLPWAPPSALFGPSLLGWNALYATLGRSAGILLWFAPVLALLALSRRREGGGDGRAWLPHAILLALLFQIVLYPFDWAGDRMSFGNPWFVPLYGALWFAIDPRAGERGKTIGAAAWAAVASLPWLLPFWLHPAALQPAEPPAATRALAPVRALAPFETSLREIPGSVEIRRGGTTLRALDRAIGSVGGSSGRLTWFGSREATVVVLSDRPLASVRLDFGDRGPTSLDVRGGAAGDTRFSPGGEVSFDVALSKPARSHPFWWSPKGVAYFLKLTLPEAPPVPVPFDLGAARPQASAAGPRPERMPG